MSIHFRPWKIDETQLLPAAVQDYVPEHHLARFVVALVRESLDLTKIAARYASSLGQPAFHYVMMTALLLYAYASGIYSSRRIAKASIERVDFMLIVAGDPPDFRTISEFRRRHLEALKGLFLQVLLLCEKAGLVKLGHVALDGTKIKANASKHKAMSYERMEARAAELEAEVARWLAAAEAADAEEDRLHGTKRGDEMPDWVADKKRRAERIRAAKAELEAQAQAAAATKAEAKAKAEAERRKAVGREPPDPPAPPPRAAKPDKKAQKNFTDPESRIMKSKDGFVQAYNAQIAVDAAQIIVARAVTQSAADSGQLVPMADAVETNLGAKPEQMSADAGYCSDANLQALEARGIDAYVATGRAKDAAAGAAEPGERIGPPTRVEAMRAKIEAGGHDSPYRLRKQLPEPVFGQIKQARGFRQFLLRGVEKVGGEWSLVCTAHNLLKLFQAWTPSAAQATAPGRLAPA